MRESGPSDPTSHAPGCAAVILLPLTFFIAAGIAAGQSSEQSATATGMRAGIIATLIVAAALAWWYVKRTARFHATTTQQMNVPLVKEIRAALAANARRGMKLTTDQHESAVKLGNCLDTYHSTRILGAWTSTGTEFVTVAVSDHIIAGVRGAWLEVFSAPLAGTTARAEGRHLVVDTPTAQWRLPMGDDTILGHQGASDRPVIGPSPMVMNTVNAIVAAINTAARQTS